MPPRFPFLAASLLGSVLPSFAGTELVPADDVPAFFLAKPIESPASPAPRFFPESKPWSPLSPQLRNQILEGGLQPEHRLIYSPPPGEAVSPLLNPPKTDGDVVLMERYVVRAEKAPVVLGPVEKSRPFRDALRTGKLYHSVGRRFTTDISLFASNMGTVSSSGTQLTPMIPRLELAIRFSW